ncbi:MAG: hypothetical protein JWP63_4128 [Candidatus Solibacter sp.]|nr:hypothetical protein [Candidatus Solibacter sp.]
MLTTQPLPDSGSPCRSTGKRGYILVATALSLPFLLGVGGLAIDIGRMYITKNEAQAYVDSASLAAAKQLDGTTAGIARASAAAGADTGKWRFDTTPFSGVTTKFSTSSSGPFVAAPTSAAGYLYAHVVATVDLPMYLIRVLTGPTATISAASVAGASTLTTLPSGVFPFSPYTRIASPDNASDPYGYRIGNQYTFRWGAPGDKTSCGTDATMANLSQNGSVRGYCCVSNSAADLRQAIVGGRTDSVTIGQSINMDNGAKNTEMSAIGDRVAIDTNTTSATYAAYRAAGTGNGARVVVVAVNGGAPNYINVGFAGFFLLNSDSYDGLNGNDSACAEYIGAWTQGETAPAPGGSGGYRLRLVK